MTNDSLNPCPFCGGEAIKYDIPAHKHGMARQMPDHAGSFCIECIPCGVGIIRDMESSVVAAWNKRAQPAPESGVQAKLRDFLTRYAEANAQWFMAKGPGIRREPSKTEAMELLKELSWSEIRDAACSERVRSADSEGRQVGGGPLGYPGGEQTAAVPPPATLQPDDCAKAFKEWGVVNHDVIIDHWDGYDREEVARLAWEAAWEAASLKREVIAPKKCGGCRGDGVVGNIGYEVICGLCDGTGKDQGRRGT